MKNFTLFFTVLLCYVYCSSCSNQSTNEKKKLTANQWVVEQANFEIKNKYLRDTLFAKRVEAAFTGRLYDFKSDGNFAITTKTKTITGRWNFGKDDSDLLYHDIGAKQTMVIMRNPENSQEVWMPLGGKSIFLDYAENTIQATVLPAFEGGNLYLTLVKK